MMGLLCHLVSTQPGNLRLILTTALTHMKVLLRHPRSFCLGAGGQVNGAVGRTRGMDVDDAQIPVELGT